MEKADSICLSISLPSIERGLKLQVIEGEGPAPSDSNNNALRKKMKQKKKEQ